MYGLFERLRRARDEHQGANQHSSDEAGAIIILALVFLVAISLAVLALMTWVGNSLLATASFNNEQSVESAATSAVNLAIQETRVTFASQMENAFGGSTTNSQPTACWFDSMGNPQQPPPLPPANVQIDVWCSMIWQPFTASTRTVTFSACPSNETNLQCVSAPLLQAVEVFDDYPPGVGVPLVNPIQCNFYNYCGQSMTQVEWQWRPTVPAVTSISTSPVTSPATVPLAGGPITITGTGFLPGSSVNFTEESGGTASTHSAATPQPVVTVPASQVTASNCTGPNSTCTTLSLTAPSVTSGVPTGSYGATYFVTVTTPGGTSPFVQPGGVLNYSLGMPTVSAISGTQESGGVPGGSITGGSSVTITGTNFLNTSNFAAQVWFWCDTGTNSACPSGTQTPVQAGNVNVTSGTSLTAVTPAVTVAGDWYVQVDTLGGNSTATTYDFNYGVQVPIIIGLSPTSGAGGTQVTITGGNFLTGSTVSLYLDQGGNQTGSPITATVGSGLTPTTMTITIPTSGLTNGAAYFPVITLPPVPGYSGPTTSQPYNEPADIFTYTVVTPTVNVTYPTNGTHFSWSGPIAGTASSNSAGTISSTAVAIEDTSTGKWWSGTAFTATSQTFVPATGTTNWTYPSSSFSATNLTPGDSYSVTGEAKDSLNNVGFSSTINFTYQ